jgi:hypothetical protein
LLHLPTLLAGRKLPTVIAGGEPVLPDEIRVPSVSTGRTRRPELAEGDNPIRTVAIGRVAHLVLDDGEPRVLVHLRPAQDFPRIFAVHVLPPPLESASTLGVLKTFAISKSWGRSFGFLGVEHVDYRYSTLRSRAAAKQAPRPMQT